MRVRQNEEMHCRINQHNRELSAQQGKYIDLKAEPDRACELPEAKDWPALGAFTSSLNRCPLFATTGCTAAGKTVGGHEAPFVDISFADRELAGSEVARKRLKERLSTLDAETSSPDF